MRRFSRCAAVLVMLVVMLPVLACAATPGMSRAEQSCCRQPMHRQCGGMVRQSCCQLEVRGDLSQRSAQVQTVPAPVLAAVAVLSPLPAELPASAEYLRHILEEHSPPGLQIASTTVLRI